MNDTTKTVFEREEADVVDTSQMTEGKREALELAEASRERFWEYPTFAGGLFMGRFPWNIVFPFPAQSDQDRIAGDNFLGSMDEFLREHADPDQIDADGEIPDEVIDGLAKLGAFGIKIPTELGGLGMSQVNYIRAATLLGSFCGNLTALVSAHQSIGVPQPLLLFGTEEQKKKYLPRVAKGEISAFALTEVGVGSDPAKMTTRAESTADGSEFIINGEKLWCTNGTKAGVIVVMAATPPKIVKGKERNQITAFVVDMDTPGIHVERRCRFMGLRALYNAVISFTDVRVSRNSILMGEGRGLRVALTTLNTGRLTLPSACAGLAKKCLEVTREWASERVQWGAPIGQHSAIADKIAQMAANVFAMEAMTLLTAGLVDRKETDIRLEAAMCKMWGSEQAWKIVDETMQIRGGRGYETAQSLVARGEDPIAVERYMRDCRINMIFEGSSEIMRLFIAREALDPHLRIGAAAMNSQLPMGERVKASLQAAGFWAKWYPRQWFSFSNRDTSKLDPQLRGHADYAARTSRKLARTLFHGMVRYGPRLEREQILLGRMVEIGTELFAIAATCSYAQHKVATNMHGEDALNIADFFCREARRRISHLFKDAGRNNDHCGYRLARDVLDGKYAWLEDGIIPQSEA